MKNRRSAGWPPGGRLSKVSSSFPLNPSARAAAGASSSKLKRTSVGMAFSAFFESLKWIFIMGFLSGNGDHSVDCLPCFFRDIPRDLHFVFQILERPEDFFQ